MTCCRPGSNSTTRIIRHCRGRHGRDDALAAAADRLAGQSYCAQLAPLERGSLARGLAGCMMLAVGMLVDNAVVVTESISRHRELDPTRAGPATVRGVSEVGVATLAGTAATIIVFLQLVFGERSQTSIFLVHVAIPIVVAMGE